MDSDFLRLMDKLSTEDVKKNIKLLFPGQYCLNLAAFFEERVKIQ